MFIPLGTDRPLRRRTVVTYALLVINVAVFLAQTYLGNAEPELHARIFEPLVLDPMNPTAWAFFSYAFLHGGLMHILFNMIFLWVFGPNVEDRFGRVGFLIFYLLGGAAAGGLHALFYPVGVVGASGAIAAVTGAYLVLFPHTTIRTLVVFFIIGVFNIPAMWFIGVRIALDLVMEGARLSGNVATLAHLGGYAFGIAVSVVLLWTRLLPREPYDLFTLSRHANRRRQFRGLTRERTRLNRQGKHADQAMRASQVDDATTEAVALARAEIATNVSEQKFDVATVAYRQLVERFAAVPGAILLNRGLQYDIANALFRAGDHQTAATAYEVFLQAYPNDSESPNVHLMLGLINARYLNDPVRAKQEIEAALSRLGPGPQQDLAKELMEELG